MNINELEWSGGEKTTIENVRKMEQELGVSFPKEYIEIVLEYNGGTVEPQRFEAKSGERWVFLWLLRLNEIAETIELMKEENRHLENTVPIYQDGNYAVCLDYRESETEPKVFFNDYTRPEDDVEEGEIDTFIDPIADSFKEFLECLFE